MDTKFEPNELEKQLDYLSILEERMLAIKKENFFHVIAGFCTIGGLSFLAFQSTEIAFLAACAAVLLILQIGRMVLSLTVKEFDRMLFSFPGNMEILRTGLKSRRSAASMISRQKYYYGEHEGR